jgi:hypothetical protein
MTLWSREMFLALARNQIPAVQPVTRRYPKLSRLLKSSSVEINVGCEIFCMKAGGKHKMGAI